ncbi:hypothetical protein HDU98_010373 [Podochytrium sp. JEL0797]|nr:hypothetical protein HDU98_010373 [Podochytrium sp. JEL0797]
MLANFLTRRKSVKETKNKLSSVSGGLLGSRKDRSSVQSVQSRNNGEGDRIASTLSPPPPPGPPSASILSIERLDIGVEITLEPSIEPSMESLTEEKVIEAVREVQVEKEAEALAFEVVAAESLAPQVEIQNGQSGSGETAPAAETIKIFDTSDILAAIENASLFGSIPAAVVVSPVETGSEAPQPTDTPNDEEAESSIPPPNLTTSNTPTESTTSSDLPLPINSPRDSTTPRASPKPIDEQNPYNKNNKYGRHVSMNAHQIRMAELLWADTLVSEMLCRGFEEKDVGLCMAAFHDHCMLIVSTVDVPRLGIEGKRTIYYGWRDIRGWVQDCFDRDVKLRLDSKLTGTIFRSDPGALEMEVAEGIYSGSLKGSLEDYLVKTMTIFLSEFDEN